MTGREVRGCADSRASRRQALRLAVGRAGRRRALWEAQRAAAVRDLILDAVPAGGGIAADLGSGTGAVARRLAPYFDRVIAVDRCLCALRLSTDRPGSDGAVTYMAGDAENLPLRDRSVDVVYCYGALHHVSVRRVAAEIRRVLVPAGTAVIVDYTTPGSSTPLPHVVRALRAFSGYRRRLGLQAALSITLFRMSPSWIAHLCTDRFLSPAEFRRQLDAALPGASFVDEPTRSIAVWQAPEAPRERATGARTL